LALPVAFAVGECGAAGNSVVRIGVAAPYGFDAGWANAVSGDRTLPSVITNSDSADRAGISVSSSPR
jgi:hypothetical protein